MPSPADSGRPPTRSPSRSQSGARSQSKSSDGAQEVKRYASRTPSSRSRSRSPSPSRRRSYTRSRSRSHTPSEYRSRSDSHSTSRRSLRSSETPRRRSASPSAAPDRDHDAKPNYQPRLELGGHSAAISQVRISPDGKWIASASADGIAKVWDSSTGAHLETLVGHMAGISCVAWAPDSNTLATGSDDKAIRLWDRVTASPSHSVGDEGPSERLVRGKGGTVIAVPRSGRAGRGPLLGHHNYVYCLAFSPKGNMLASGSYDEAVFLWDVRAGRLMRSLPAHSDPVSGIDFCRDGTLVASCSTDGLIRIWDTSTGQCLRTLVHEDNPGVSNVCFSPNGRFVLAFNLDNCIRLWDYVSGTVKKTYQGHQNSGFSVGGSFGSIAIEEAAHHDRDDTGRAGPAFIASASEDGDIVLWDVTSKQIVQRISKAHNGVCFWVDIHGDTLVSAGQDCKIKVFKHKRADRLPVAPNGIREEEQEKEEEEAAGLTNGHTEDAIMTPYPPAAEDTIPIKQEEPAEEQA